METEKTSGEVLPEIQKQPFRAELADAVLAAIVFILGYFFTRRVFFTWLGWSVAAFTTLYLCAVWFYALKKGFSVKNKEALFWSAIVWLTGLSFALWDGRGMGVKPLFLFCAAAYLVLVLTDRTLLGHTGNLLAIDGLNALIFIPFRNFFNQYKALPAFRRKKTDSLQIRKRLPVLFGILLGIIMLVWLIPLLLRADSGGFSKIIDAIGGVFNFKSPDFSEFIVYAALSLPVSAYMFGLISGAAHGRNTDTIKKDSLDKGLIKLRFIPAVTVYIALGTVCVLYAVFVFSQIPYFFSAFTGVRPDGWLSYSEFAREGFFELCRISVINLALMAACNAMCQKPCKDLLPLRGFNAALSLITLVLISTALSKMGLYIDSFGLTMLRLLTCSFMVFLAVVFAAVIVLQKRSFSIVRLALVTGCAMFCLLSLTNPDAIVVRYNTGRYLAGTLDDYDLDILYNAGSAGIVPALEVYKKTENDGLKHRLKLYLDGQRMHFHRGSYEWEMSLESYTAGRALENYTYFKNP